MFRLLIVDDNADARKALSRAIDARPAVPMEILFAATLEEALCISEEMQPDFTFFDLHLPDAGEGEVIAAISRMKPPVFVVSGIPADTIRAGQSVDIEAECIAAGARAYIEKATPDFFTVQMRWLEMVSNEYSLTQSQLPDGHR